MDFLKILSDPYDRKARLYPALLLIFPAITFLIAYLQTILSFLQMLVPIAGSCGIMFLLTQLVRDKGKKQEPKLFKVWGGMPSTVIFRHTDKKLDSVTKARYHQKLSAMCQTISLLTIEEEQADTNAADIVYQAWSHYLRSQTRDKNKFHLLFQENINYGYRRNIFGIRFIGIAVSVVCVILSGIWLYNAYINKSFIMGQYVAAVVSIIFLFLWIAVITDKWVRIPADAYAERLAESVDLLDP